MEKDNTTFPEIIWGAFVTATMFMPVHYLSNILSWKFNVEIIILFVIPLLCGVFMAAALFSEKVRYALMKWGLSLPISFVMWRYFISNDFYMRSLNWAIPNYGDSTVGGDIAGFIAVSSLLFIEMPFVGIAIGISHKVKNQKLEKALNVMEIIASVVCIVITLTVIHLNTIMPQYEPVYG